MRTLYPRPNSRAENAGDRKSGKRTSTPAKMIIEADVPVRWMASGTTIPVVGRGRIGTGGRNDSFDLQEDEGQDLQACWARCGHSAYHTVLGRWNVFTRHGWCDSYCRYGRLRGIGDVVFGPLEGHCFKAASSMTM